ncbi:MAG: hypothetical protein AAF497_27505, partial [Planctomycetota bacterium]
GPGRRFLPGDANLDGFVDVTDFNQWNANKFTSLPSWCGGDFSADGVIDVSDFNIWNVNKFTSSDSATVPEPTGLIWFGLMLAGWTFTGIRLREPTSRTIRASL